MAAPLATTLETEICGARRCSPSPRCDSQQTYEKNEWSLDVLAVLGSGILPTPEPTLGKVFPRVKQGQQVQARKAHEQVPAAKFELGQLVATPGALAALELGTGVTCQKKTGKKTNSLWYTGSACCRRTDCETA